MLLAVAASGYKGQPFAQQISLGAPLSAVSSFTVAITIDVNAVLMHTDDVHSSTPMALYRPF